MGEGGALIVNSKDNCLRAEIVREKGTNRAEFLLGMVDKYTWVSEGSSYLPSELGAAYLYAQLLEADNINEMQPDPVSAILCRIKRTGKERKAYTALRSGRLRP